jgi:preprotein translocase subunit SecA
MHKQEAQIVEEGKAGVVTIATNMAGRGTDIAAEVKAVVAIVGTERHDSRRVDRQLEVVLVVKERKFTIYVSLEDNLMRLFGSEK